MGKTGGRSKGLARIKEIYSDRGQRARELKAQGKKIIGYLNGHPPVELIAAAGMFPYVITGDMAEPITEADAYLEAIMCPFVRSSFDLMVKGKYDFLDGLVMAFSCDNIKKSYDVWRYYFKPSYARMVMLPHVVHPGSQEFYKAELYSFKKSIERFTQQEISLPALRETIAQYNEYRALIRQLYEMRKPDPPLLSGARMTQIIIASLSLPVEESIPLLQEVIREIKEGKEAPPQRKARVLLYASHINEASFLQMIEDSGANVVVDDMFFGTRQFGQDVEPTEDPLDGLVARYLDKLPSPRTYRDSPGNREADLENRFGHIKRYAQEFQVNGAILAITRYCDTHEYEAPDVRDYLQRSGIPVLHIEHDYSTSTFAPLRTRVQAFLEMIG
jgi:bcr-type benzoyl-CoA reductase subunit C